MYDFKDELDDKSKSVIKPLAGLILYLVGSAFAIWLLLTVGELIVSIF